MILQVLYEYYERKPEIQTPDGYEKEELDFIVFVRTDGTFLDLLNRRENNKGHEYLVPRGVIRTAAPKPNLLWDKHEYVFGVSKDPSRGKQEKARKYNQTFIERINNLPNEIKSDPGVKAVISFYQRKQVSEVLRHQAWEECLNLSGWISFQLEGDEEIIPMRESVRKYQGAEFLSGGTDGDDETKAVQGRCLVTGERGVIARLHTEMRLPGSDKNVKIVSFQKNSGFGSYGKEQAFNAPVCVRGEAAYSGALKHLLSSSSNRVHVGDSTIIFWVEKKPESFDLERELPWYVSASPKDDPDRGIKAVRALYAAARTGRLPLEEGNRFYVLGLSPNAARIAIRLWKVGTVRQFGERILEHFKDLEIIKPDYDYEFCTLDELLASASIETKDRKKPNVVYFKGRYYDVPPNLAGSVVTSILDGAPYPVTLLQQCIRRIRAERNVTRARAAILKASFNRFHRIQKTFEKEVTVSLDKTNTNPGYLLGRLFSVLERVQNAANNNKEPNAGIRDRFYGAFSSSPITVLPLLEKLYGHHLGKIEKSKGYFESIKGEIIDKLDAQNIPPHLPMDQQALFAIGYYHQRQEFFTGKKNSDESEQSTLTTGGGDLK